MFSNITDAYAQNKIKYITSGVFTTAGIFYAVHKQKGFWGIVGFGLLGVITGSIVGGVISNVATK